VPDDQRWNLPVHAVRGASGFDAICRPAWLYSLIQKQASRTVPGWLRPVSPVPVGRLVHHAVPLLQGRDLFNIYFRPSLPAPGFTPRQATQHLRLGVVRFFALHHRYRASPGPELHQLLTAHLATYCPITAWACALSTDALS